LNSPKRHGRHVFGAFDNVIVFVLHCLALATLTALVALLRALLLPPVSLRVHFRRDQLHLQPRLGDFCLLLYPTDLQLLEQFVALSIDEFCILLSPILMVSVLYWLCRVSGKGQQRQ